MKLSNKIFLFLSLSLVLISTGCKSELEKIRTSGDPNLVYMKAFEYYDLGKYLKAQSLFELILHSYKGSAEAEKMYFAYADTHYQLGNYSLSSYYFKSFANTFKNSDKVEEATFLVAKSYYNDSPTYRLDQTKTQSAIDAFQEFANLFPTSKKVSLCNKYIDELRAKLETKSFAEGKLYFDTGNYQSAETVFSNMLIDFPDTKKSEELKFMIVKSNYLLAENSIFDKREERLEKTLKKCNEFKHKYPNSIYTPELDIISNKTINKLKTFQNG